MKTLVTGASGMLGRAIVKTLAQELPETIIFSLARSQPLPTGVEALSESGMSSGLFDVVIHAASPASPAHHTDPVPVFDSNVRLTQSALAAVRPGGVFVFISTGEVYGPSAKTGVTEAQLPQPQLTGPRSYYPLSKIVGESIAISRPDVRSLVFRTFHTFGPGVRREDGRSFADFLWGAVMNQQVVLTSNGSAVRSFLHVDDFSSGVVTGVLKVQAQGVFNIGEPREMSILEFASRVAEISGSPLVRQAGKEFDRALQSPISRLSPDVSKLESIGWKRVHTPDDAIRDTLAWIRSLN